MEIQKIREIVSCMDPSVIITESEAFQAEEDGNEYQVWKLTTASTPLVLKKTNYPEQETYEGSSLMAGRFQKCMVSTKVGC